MSRETALRWKTYRDIIKGVKKIVDAFKKGEKAGEIAAREPIVIDKVMFDQVAAETKRIKGARFTNVRRVDPWAGGIEVSALVGSDLQKALEESVRIEQAYFDTDYDVRMLENELNAMEVLQGGYKEQAEMLYQLQKSVELMLDELAVLDRTTLYWYVDLDTLNVEVNARNTDLARKIKEGRANLAAANEWKQENTTSRADVNSWVEKVIVTKTMAQRGETFARMCDRIRELAGAQAEDSSVRKLAAILTQITADNDRVRSEAEGMRADAELLRSESHVGPDVFDLFLGLARIGSGVLAEDEPARTSPAPAPPKKPVRPRPNSILLERGGKPVPRARRAPGKRIVITVGPLRT